MSLPLLLSHPHSPLLLSHSIPHPLLNPHSLLHLLRHSVEGLEGIYEQHGGESESERREGGHDG
jgi:hypothetical protein